MLFGLVLYIFTFFVITYVGKELVEQLSRLSTIFYFENLVSSKLSISRSVISGFSETILRTYYVYTTIDMYIRVVVYTAAS